MDASRVRLLSVTVENFKNVGFGAIDLTETNGEGSSLVLCGPNGSGKSTFIEVLLLLQRLLIGRALEVNLSESLRVRAPSTRLVFEFAVREADASLVHAIYEVTIARVVADALVGAEFGQEKAVIVRERFFLWMAKKDGKQRKTCLIDTAEKGWPFGPKVRYRELVGRDKETLRWLLRERAWAYECRQSFVFSQTFRKVIQDRSSKGALVAQTARVLQRLWTYGVSELVIIDATVTGGMPFDIWWLQSLSDKQSVRLPLLVPFSGTVDLAVWAESEVRHALQRVNVVLAELLPGLVIDWGDSVRSTDVHGNSTVRMGLVAKRKGEILPLRVESTGVRRLLAVLPALIGAYNNPTMTVAVDDVCAGFFEPLLGEWLEIMTDKGRGQIILTTRTLRVLETVHRKFIAFTTADENQRYRRWKNVRGTNNLRNMYLRAVLMGDNEDGGFDLIRPTINRERLALAMERQDGGL